MWFIMLIVSCVAGVTSAIPCEEARLKCAYRVGCGRALQLYMVGCSTVLQGNFPTHCTEKCKNSLIALTSTDEGKALMDCECSDDYCLDQKDRTEICRPQVERVMNENVLPCGLARFICTADAICSKALEYYNLYCKAMFHGKKCTARCYNSIDILRRQEKAKKLETCRCAGDENFDCFAIQHNMEKLCFHKHSKSHNNTHHHVPKKQEEPTVVLVGHGTCVGVSWIALFAMVIALVT